MGKIEPNLEEFSHIIADIAERLLPDYSVICAIRKPDGKLASISAPPADPSEMIDLLRQVIVKIEQKFVTEGDTA